MGEGRDEGTRNCDEIKCKTSLIPRFVLTGEVDGLGDATFLAIKYVLYLNTY